MCRSVNERGLRTKELSKLKIDVETWVGEKEGTSHCFSVLRVLRVYTFHGSRSFQRISRKEKRLFCSLLENRSSSVTESKATVSIISK